MTNAPQNIAAYLDALKAALKGAPPGLVADALADAEEHLRGAMAAHPGESEVGVFAEMAQSYGSPEEVAAEYLAIETPPSGPFSKKPAAPAPVRATAATAGKHRPYPGFFSVVKDPVTYGALLYMLLSLATGVFYFTWAGAGLSLSPVFLILVIGIPFFLLFIGSVRMFSYAEGRIVETLLGVRMPRRLPVPPGGSFWGRLKATLADVRTWSSLAYMLLMLPLGIFYFTIAVTGLAISGAFVGGGLWDAIDFGNIRIVSNDPHNTGLLFNEHGGGWTLSNPPGWMLPFAHTPLLGLLCVAAGILAFFLLLHAARMIGWLHGRIAEQLLVRL